MRTRRPSGEQRALAQPAPVPLLQVQQVPCAQAGPARGRSRHILLRCARVCARARPGTRTHTHTRARARCAHDRTRRAPGPAGSGATALRAACAHAAAATARTDAHAWCRCVRVAGCRTCSPGCRGRTRTTRTRRPLSTRRRCTEASCKAATRKGSAVGAASHAWRACRCVAWRRVRCNAARRASMSAARRGRQRQRQRREIAAGGSSRAHFIVLCEETFLPLGRGAMSIRF